MRYNSLKSFIMCRKLVTGEELETFLKLNLENMLGSKIMLLNENYFTGDKSSLERKV